MWDAVKDQVWGVTQTRLQLEERDEDADGRAVLRGEVGVVVPPLDETRRVRQVVERHKIADAERLRDDVALVVGVRRQHHREVGQRVVRERPRLL